MHSLLALFLALPELGDAPVESIVMHGSIYTYIYDILIINCDYQASQKVAESYISFDKIFNPCINILYLVKSSALLSGILYITLFV